LFENNLKTNMRNLVDHIESETNLESVNNLVFRYIETGIDSTNPPLPVQQPNMLKEVLSSICSAVQATARVTYDAGKVGSMMPALFATAKQDKAYIDSAKSELSLTEAYAFIKRHHYAMTTRRKAIAHFANSQANLYVARFIANSHFSWAKAPLTAYAKGKVEDTVANIISSVFNEQLAPFYALPQFLTTFKTAPAIDDSKKPTLKRTFRG
jgi:hypothetical protein